MNKKLLARSIGHAVLAFTYIFGIAAVLHLTGPEKMFQNVPEFFAPIIMLLLFVLSAAVMAILVFGKPVLLYLENQKKEALTMLFFTVGWLAAILFLTIVTVLIIF